MQGARKAKGRGRGRGSDSVPQSATPGHPGAPGPARPPAPHPGAPGPARPSEPHGASGAARPHEPGRQTPQVPVERVPARPVTPQQLAPGKGRGRGIGRGDSPTERPQSRQELYREPSETTRPHEPGSQKVPPTREVKAPQAQKMQRQAVQSEDVLKIAGLSLEPAASESGGKKEKMCMAKRVKPGTVGRPIALLVNYFKLTFKDITVYHYDVDISEVGRDKKPGKSVVAEGRTKREDLQKKVAHVEHQQKRNMGKAKCREIISEMITKKSLNQYCPVYDGQKNIFTNKPFPFKDKMSFNVPVVFEGKEKTFCVTIQAVQKEDNSNIISLEPLREVYLGRCTDIPQEVLLVFDTVMNHRVPPLTQVQARNSFFPFTERGKNPLECGLEVWFGFSQSVRLTQRGPVVVINVAAKAFHKAGPVISYASDVLGSDITKLPRMERYHTEALSKALKGVRVQVTHQRQPRKYKVKGLSKLSARDLTFSANENRQMSIVQYFREQYQYNIKYPNLPCLHMQTSTNTTYLPMETCLVVEGQPKIGKLTGEQTSRMIKKTAVAPRDRFDKILEDAHKINNMCGRTMNDFGLIMDVRLLQVNGRVMAAPKLAYGGSEPACIAVPDDRGTWRMEGGKKFYRVTKIEKWILISFANEKFFGMNKLTYLADLLAGTSRKCGMSFGKPITTKIFDRRTTTEQAVLFAKQSGAEFAVVVLSRRDNLHSYEEVKFLSDFKYNLVTQCLEDKTLGRINDQITTNVCLKLNVKLGGINHVLLQRPRIFSQPIIVFGADAIHWPRDYGYPSIASVVGSLNPTASRYALTCKLQRNEKESKISQEIILDMGNIVKGILGTFRAQVGRDPCRIILFRDGVSEGQFESALEHEVAGIQKACKELYNEILPMTFIVVQKRHQTRFRPKDPRDGKGKMGNVPPGTVVDTEITHPLFFDYFVCSHEGIQGTSKPAHYTVLHDDNHLSSDELQQLSFFLCHNYARCTRSVSLPAPVLYADLAAARAKSYADLYIESDQASSVSSDSTRRDLPPNVVEAIESMKSFENNMFYI